jgi:hypothetical protein
MYRHQIGDVRNFYKDKYRLFFLNDGFFGHENDILPELVRHCDMAPKIAGPRLSKIIIAGLPGSGRQTVAEMIEGKYNHIHGITMANSSFS